VTSTIIYSSTGAPPGTVLAPFLLPCIPQIFVLPERVACNSQIKFADNTALIGLITNNDDADYLDDIRRFVKYFDDNFLVLNVKKTQEMKVPNEVVIEEVEVERVNEYKYF
jgi:hypothetical protein